VVFVPFAVYSTPYDSCSTRTHSLNCAYRTVLDVDADHSRFDDDDVVVVVTIDIVDDTRWHDGDDTWHFAATDDVYDDDVIMHCYFNW